MRNKRENAVRLADCLHMQRFTFVFAVPYAGLWHLLSFKHFLSPWAVALSVEGVDVCIKTAKLQW